MTDQNGNDKLLSYGDNLLRRSDVDLLDGPFWLNDQVLLWACKTLYFVRKTDFFWLAEANVPIHIMQIITFYFDYLWREVYAAQQSSLLFVGGAMTFLLSQLAGVGRYADAQQFGSRCGACSQL